MNNANSAQTKIAMVTNQTTASGDRLVTWNQRGEFSSQRYRGVFLTKAELGHAAVGARVVIERYVAGESFGMPVRRYRVVSA